MTLRKASEILTVCLVAGSVLYLLALLFIPTERKNPPIEESLARSAAALERIADRLDELEQLERLRLERELRPWWQR